MPEEIKDEKKLKASARLREEDIRFCLENGKSLSNHIVDFDLYVRVWKKIKNPKATLYIHSSVIWSFEEGRVNLTKFIAKPTNK